MAWRTKNFAVCPLNIFTLAFLFYSAQWPALTNLWVIARINAKRQAISGSIEKNNQGKSDSLAAWTKRWMNTGVNLRHHEKYKNNSGVAGRWNWSRIFLSGKWRRKKKKPGYFFFAFTFFFGLVLPCEPRKILPFLVFLSPFPIKTTPPSFHITNNT